VFLAPALANGSSIMVELSTLNPKFEGLNPATGTGRDKMARNSAMIIG